MISGLASLSDVPVNKLMVTVHTEQVYLKPGSYGITKKASYFTVCVLVSERTV